jgi:hypothetical protein
MKFKLTVLKDLYSIYRLDKDSSIPDWTHKSDFYSITRTNEELSVVCKHVDIKLVENVIIDKHWRIFKINGPLDLSQVGIIAHISDLFKKQNISIYPIATYDTDYILIKDNNTYKAIKILENEGHKVFIEK